MRSKVTKNHEANDPHPRDTSTIIITDRRWTLNIPSFVISIHLRNKSSNRGTSLSYLPLRRERPLELEILDGNFNLESFEMLYLLGGLYLEWQILVISSIDIRRVRARESSSVTGRKSSIERMR